MQPPFPADNRDVARPARKSRLLVGQREGHDGAVQTLTTGAAYAVTEMCQNNRLQTTGVRLAALSSSAFLSGCAAPAMVAGDALFLGLAYGTAGANNGNVSKKAIGGLSVTQAYTYDAFNRLKSAGETGGTNEWSQTYDYDQFGNRAVTAGNYSE